MKSTIKIGTPFGIGLYLHFTFILLLAVVGWGAWLSAGKSWSALTVSWFLAAAFVCLLLHELGHALVGRFFGIQTKEITLLPIGGSALRENNPEKPFQELWISLAGPATSLAVALFLILGLHAMNRFGTGQDISLFGDTVWSWLVVINLFLAGLNLLPAFPMDGGRVLRSLLAKRLGWRRGTAIASNMGLGIAMILGVMGLFYNPWLLLLAVFIFVGARPEAACVEMQLALKGMRVSDAMMTRYRTLSAHDSLDVAAGELLASGQTDFPVVENGRVMGILSRKDLIQLLEIRPVSTQVGQVLPREFLAVDGTDSLLAAVEKMRRRNVTSVPIVMGNFVIGLLTTDHINELIRLNSVLMRRSELIRECYLPAFSRPNEVFQEQLIKS